MDIEDFVTNLSKRIRVLEDALWRREIAEIVRRIEALEAMVEKRVQKQAAK